MTGTSMKCREETKFLALLARTQEKASKMGVSTRTFQSKNKTNRKFANTVKYFRTKMPCMTGRRRIDSTTEESSSQLNSSNEQLNQINLLQSQPSSLSTNDDTLYDWRLPKFVETLDTWLNQLERHPQ